MKICLCITRMFLFIFFYFIPTFLSSTAQLSHPTHPHHHHLGNVSDQEALLRFLSGITHDPSQSLLTTWKPNVSFCNWTGVICSRRRQRVVSLNVSSMGLEEYGLGGPVTTKGDVYSYGVVLLEMLTRKKPIDNMFVEGMNLQKWVGSSFPNRVGEVVDKSILRRINTIAEEDKELNCLNHLVSMGLLCTKESPKERPTMINIVSTLQNIKETFLGAAGIPEFQSDTTHFLDRISIVHNNTDQGQSSSTF